MISLAMRPGRRTDPWLRITKRGCTLKHFAAVVVSAATYSTVIPWAIAYRASSEAHLVRGKQFEVEASYPHATRVVG